jgi:hypothetical protein
MKSPERWRTGVPPGGKNGSKESSLDVSRYRRPIIEGP